MNVYSSLRVACQSRALCKRVIPIIALTFSTSLSLRAQTNEIPNPGFESGSYPGLWGGSSVVPDNQRTGSYALKLEDEWDTGGGLETTVDGLAPNTKYVFSAWVKVAGGGSIAIGAADFGGTDAYASTTSSSYTLLSVDFETGPNSDSAKLFLYNEKADDNTGYADDLSLVRFDLNLVSNPGFESGSSTGLWGGSSVVADNQKAGDYALKAEDNDQWGGGMERTISGLTPNTTYLLSASLKTSGGPLLLGAKNFGGNEISVSTDSATYVTKSLSFTTGVSSSSATIYVWNPPQDNSTGYADTIRLVPQGVNPNRFSDSGFESGSSTWLWGGSSVVSSDPRTGSFSARIVDDSQWGGGLEHTVGGLSPNTTYEFSAWVKVVGGGSIALGAKDFGGHEVAVFTTSTDYTELSVTFTTGPAFTSAKIYVYNPVQDDNAGFVDDMRLAVSDIPEYTLVWSDEFNTNGDIDSSKWVPEVGFHRNHEDQYYTADNLTQLDGDLVITALRETNFPNPSYVAGSSDWRTSREYAEFTAGSINTIGKHSWLFGRMVVRAKVTNELGTWPAIWTVGQGEWPSAGEIDIMENYQGKILGNFAVAGSGRWNAKWDSANVAVSALGSDFASKYHIWTLEWDENRATIWVDDVLVNDFDLNSPEALNAADSFAAPGGNPFKTSPQFMWLNLAIGGDAGGDTSGLPDVTEYLVDYVRIYQK